MDEGLPLLTVAAVQQHRLIPHSVGLLTGLAPPGGAAQALLALDLDGGRAGADKAGGDDEILAGLDNQEATKRFGNEFLQA